MQDPATDHLSEGLLIDDGYDVTFEEFDGGHQIPFSISQSALDWFLDVS